MSPPPDPNTNAFTFLNYDSPGHNASHRRAVKSHISSKYRTAVRQQAQPRYALPHRTTPESIPTPTRAGSEHTPSPKPKRRKPTPLSRPDNLNRVHRSDIASTLPLVSGALRTDPFNALPGRRTPCVAGALDYYIKILAPLQEPLQLTIGMTNPLMSWVFPVFISHESAYHGAVALSQAYMEKQRFPMSRPSAEVGFHRQRAVALLRDQIDNLNGRQPDNGMMIAVLALASLDVVYQEDSLTNRKGLALLVALKGGLDSLGHRGLIKAYLVAFDYFWMLETGAESLFPLSKRRQRREYPRIPFEAGTLSILSTLPPGFAVVAQQGTLGMDVLRILSRVSMSSSSAFKPVDGEEHPDIFDTCSCLHASSSTEHSLEKNLCLAVILFSFDKHNTSSSSAKITAYRGSRKELTRSLPYTQIRNMEERNCLTWIWIVLLGSWSSDPDFHGHTSELSRVFFENIEEARRWEGVEILIRQFFWHDGLARRWHDSWRQALVMFQDNSMSQWQSLWPDAPASPKHYSSIPFRGSTQGQSSRPTPSPTNSTSSIPKAANNEGQKTLVLPPMVTLDTYSGQIK